MLQLLSSLLTLMWLLSMVQTTAAWAADRAPSGSEDPSSRGARVTSAEGEPPPGDETSLDRGDSQASQGKRLEAVLAWRDAYLRRLPSNRDLAFMHPVFAALLPRDALQARILRELDQEYPPEKIRADSIALSTFGFFDLGLDLRSVYLDLLTEEIGGYYDPDSKILYVVLAGPKPKKWWNKLFGEGSDFDTDEVKAVLSHEMSHALADQHFDLYSLQRSTMDDDDVALAVTALVEGDATLAMFVEMGGRQGRAMIGADPDVMAGYFKLVMPIATTFAGGTTFRRAPLILRETLLFPYIQGIVLCMKLTAGGKWDRVNAAFRSPPASTEQVLHPEKYGGPESGGDPPTALTFPAACPLSEVEWELVKENVLGELQIEILLREKLGRSRSGAAAAGWDGDTYRVYRRKSEPHDTTIVWASVWDSEAEAGEFAEAVSDHFKARAAAESSIRTEVRRSGASVFVVHGRLDASLSVQLLDWAAKLGTAEKKVEIRRFETRARFAGSEIEQTF